MALAGRIVITGLGAITPFGDLPQTIAGVFSGTSAIRRLPPEFDICPTRIGGLVPPFDLATWFDPRATKRIGDRAERPSQLSHIAIVQALQQASLLDENGRIPAPLQERIGINMGTGIGPSERIEKISLEMEAVRRAQDEQDRTRAWKALEDSNVSTAMRVLPDAVAYQPTIHFGIKGPCDCSIKACATGAGNIRRAAMEISLGFADVMVAGATESLFPIDVLPFNTYARRGALSRRNDEPQKASCPFDEKHDGFVPAEGAGAVVLERYSHAKARHATILGELIGFGETTDAEGATDPSKSSQIRAMRMALAMAGISPNQVGAVNTHGTSTRAGDGTELQAIIECFGPRRDLYLYALKSLYGHTLGASGALAAILAIVSMQRGEVPPTINLVNPIPEAQICKDEHAIHEEGCYLNIPRIATAADLLITLVNSFGFGGQNVCLLLKKGE